jgi:hypothetical protein
MNDNDDRNNKHPESQPVLNRLLAIEEYSLANYLLNAHPGSTGRRAASPGGLLHRR